jgi:hypothetical protein
MDVDLELIGKALGARRAALAAALERLDSFAFQPAGDLRTGAAVDEHDEVTRALVLRALRAAFDPNGWRVLTLLADSDSTTMQIATALGTPRIVAWEQVNDLVQAGLAGRELDGDRVAITDAGRGLAALVGRLTEAASA